MDMQACETKSAIGASSEPVVDNIKLDNAGRPIEFSEVHGGDTDSSDDEDNKNYLTQKYNDFGKFTKEKLKEIVSKSSSNVFQKPTTWNRPEKKQNIVTPVSQGKLKSENNQPENYANVYGIRIINPLISSQSLKEKMDSRQPVTMDNITNHLINLDPNKDWVVAGVIVSKSTRTSQKGKQYCMWTLSDLKPGLKTLTLFLFGKAYTKLWKTNVGAVVAVLNPSVMETKSSSTDVAVLSINDQDQVMMWGTSKDLGVCKAMKKNGDPCKSFVNLRECEYCIYHVKQEYKKFTGRSELQSPCGGNLQNLRNKVLGKNEVFYGGKSYSANTVPAKQNRKAVDKDNKRLQNLGGTLFSAFQSPSAKTQLPLPARCQQMKDAERLRKLTGSPVTISSTIKNSLLRCGKLQDIGKDNTSGTNSNRKELQQDITFQNKNNFKNQTVLRKQEPIISTSGPKPLKNVSSSTSSSCMINLDSRPKIKDSLGCKNGNDLKNRTKLQPVYKMKEIKGIDFDSKVIRKLQMQNKNPLITKMQPTKTRFDNLTKVLDDGPKTLKKDNLFSSVNSNGMIDLDDPVSKFGLLDECKQNDNNKINSLENKTASPLNEIKQINSSDFDGKSNSSFKLNKKSPLQTNTRFDNLSKGVEDGEGQINPLSRNAEFVKSSRAVSSIIDLSLPITKNQAAQAKMNAVRLIKKRGPITKIDPNALRRKSPKNGTKRVHKLVDNEVVGEENFDGQEKEKCILSARFLELMNATSQNEDLVEQEEQKKLEEYYNKMEKKEQLEEKMLSTFKIDCKAVRCLKCKYKWFSASEHCKSEGHPLKIITAVKRFFKCGNCGNRTITLEIIPLHNCKQCGSSSWERAPMMKERKSSNLDQLSIRGGEQKFMNSVESNGNLNLLVPD